LTLFTGNFFENVDGLSLINVSYFPVFSEDFLQLQSTIFLTLQPLVIFKQNQKHIKSHSTSHTKQRVEQKEGRKKQYDLLAFPL
jgi:hypothetical protein